MESPINYINKLKTQRIKLIGQRDILQQRISAMDEEIEQYNTQMAKVQCIECHVQLGGKKHHEFKKGSVCHACFMTCLGKYREWSA